MEEKWGFERKKKEIRRKDVAIDSVSKAYKLDFDLTQIENATSD